MEKEEFINDQIKTLKMVWPEKSNDEIRKIVEKSYDKFKDVVDDM